MNAKNGVRELGLPLGESDCSAGSLNGEAATRRMPSPAVAEKPKRRRHAPEYKMRIVEEADACTQPGEIGAINSGLRAANYARYQDFILDAVLVPVDLETAKRYADMRLTLKHSGRPIPENDIWIAATCLRYDLALATNDGHFSACPGLVVENWTHPTSS